MRPVARKTVQGVAVVVLGVPALVVALAAMGWIMDIIYWAFTGHHIPDI